MPISASDGLDPSKDWVDDCSSVDATPCDEMSEGMEDR
jgi:hypothetical protein